MLLFSAMTNIPKTTKVESKMKKSKGVQILSIDETRNSIIISTGILYFGAACHPALLAPRARGLALPQQQIRPICQ